MFIYTVVIVEMSKLYLYFFKLNCNKSNFPQVCRCDCTETRCQILIALSMVLYPIFLWASYDNFPLVVWWIDGVPVLCGMVVQ